MRKPLVLLPVVLSVVGLVRTAQAGTITAVGAVTALTDISQMTSILGTGAFDEGPTSGNVPVNAYAAQGLTWRTGALTSILPGVTQPGTATQPIYYSSASFPTPILGGGTHVGSAAAFAGVVTFSSTITQVGLTASSNGTMYMTVWDMAGQMIGQVTWVPGGTSGFVGVDTLGVPIGMLAYGNDDMWNGGSYSVGGSTIITDSWVWGGACANNAQCNDNNPCTNDSCSAGLCTFVANAMPCDDNDACTQNDVCQAGACVGGNPVTCSPVDQCHVAGTCDSQTGVCSNPIAANGAACDDGNACTQADTCQGGFCTGGSPVVCAPQDTCHNPGVCSPATGTCTNPPKSDGVACSDSNACTQTDVCMGGVCTGLLPVMCPPPDQCHEPGACDQATGLCSNPAKADGTACDDGNACTKADSCQAGACAGDDPVVCTAQDDCHDAGMCDPRTGTCSAPAKADGTACDDGDACTQSDACAGGACKGSDPVACPAIDGCHAAGTCDPATGQCSQPPLADGTVCEDGNYCTLEDTCQAGVCTTGTPNDCAPDDDCHEAGTCDPSRGVCSNPAKPDGSPCAGGTCEGGVCVPAGTGGTGGAGTGGSAEGGAGATGGSAEGGSGGGGGSGGTDGGCGCGIPARRDGSAAAIGLLLALAALRRSRRPRRGG